MERILELPATQVLVPPIAMTDGELLMRFAQHGDEQAFAKIVEKHSRLVWAVCWQVLREHHAIEDAFQSTFFILAKRARTIRSCDSLCGWLYRVAYRTALRARMSIKAKPLSALGTEADTMEEWSELDEKLRAIEQDEQRAALLEELQALPEKYQQALALCYLEGKTRRAIADELGCSLETVKGRLARGRQVLRHRLIRRGVSLSLAMAAMTIPVKSATAAITPSLIGLTVTGATAWAAGTLSAAKVAGASQTVSATSAHVIHLAHQGTVAMTIASFAKPAVIAIALLGAVSGTLAVDSSDAHDGKDQSQTINLVGAAEGDAVASVDAAVEVTAPVVTVSATEAMGSADAKNAKNVEAFAIDVAEGARKMRAHAGGKTITITSASRPVDVVVPAVPPVPPVPVTAPVKVRVPKLDLQLQLKLAQLESRVSHLQLESKELEIASFGAADQEKEKLIEASREKLAEAEAEKLKIEIERQKEQIKALEEALEEQVKELGKHAAKVALDADMVAAQAVKFEHEAEAKMKAEAEKAAGKAREAAAHAAEGAKDAALQAAQAAKWRVQERAVYVDPNSDQPFAIARGHVISANAYPAAEGLPTWEQSVEAQEGASSLQPGNRIQIEIVDGDYRSIDVYTVEPMGTVALGAQYGRAEVKGLSVIQAEEIIKEAIRKVSQDAKVQVTYLHPTVSYTSSAGPPSDAAEPRYAPAKQQN